MNTQQQGIFSLPAKMNHTIEHYAPECGVVVEEFYGADVSGDMIWKLTGSWATVTDLVRRLTMEGIRARMQRNDDLSGEMKFWLVI